MTQKTITSKELTRILINHKNWIDNGFEENLEKSAKQANLRDADLSHVDLSHTDLRNANVSNTNIDFSTFPLWCGTFDIQSDDLKLVYQLLYHICRIKSTNPELDEIKKLILPYANKTHLIKTQRLPVITPI